jgi:hypothetical protein
LDKRSRLLFNAGGDIDGRIKARKGVRFKETEVRFARV